MNLPEYVSVQEVKRVCAELRIRDWTMLKKAEALLEETEKILAELETGEIRIALEDFKLGLEVELEHGIRFPEANVTNNHPILTGKIVLAHFKESLDYYQRLEVAEIEGDLLKAVVNKNTQKIAVLYKKLVKARLELSKTETKRESLKRILPELIVNVVIRKNLTMRLFQEDKALKEGRENSPKAYLRLNAGSEFPLPSSSAYKLIRY